MSWGTTFTSEYTLIEGVSKKLLMGGCIEFFPQVLLSLPCIKPHDLVAFEEALMKTSSPKEQKQHMKSLLLLATGNKLKALAAQKSVNVITNVSCKQSALFLMIAFVLDSSSLLLLGLISLDPPELSQLLQCPS
jgi:hypothetical protein